MGLVFRVGVPFTQIADSSLARRPMRQGNSLVTERHPLEQVAKSLIPCCRNRCLLNEQMSSVYRTKQKPTGLAVGITALDLLTECLQRTCREMQ